MQLQKKFLELFYKKISKKTKKGEEDNKNEDTSELSQEESSDNIKQEE